MRRSVLGLAAGLAALATSGCASLSKDECLAGAWDAIGFQDGSAGQPPSRVGEHAEACARYGVRPDLALWQAGYANGLSLYCTRSSGFATGVRGATYHGVCAGNLEAERSFVAAYADGRQVYEVRAALSDAESRWRRILNEIDDAQEDRDWARNRIDDEDVTDADRETLLRDIEELSETIGRLDEDLEDAEHAIYIIERDVRTVEGRMRAIYPEWNGQ